MKTYSALKFLKHIFNMLENIYSKDPQFNI